MSPRLKVLAVGLALLIAAMTHTVANASAQAGGDAPPTEAETIRLLKATGTDSLALQMGVYVANAMIDALRKQNTALDDSTVDMVKQEVRAVFVGHLDDMLARTVPVYARYYTSSEVREMTAFYLSPLGRKIVRVTPSLVQETTAIGEEWGRSIQPELVERITRRLSPGPASPGDGARKP